MERFFRTVRDPFLTDRPLTSLDQLNQDFQQWLAQYHERPHSGIDGRTPHQARLQSTNVFRELPGIGDSPVFHDTSRGRWMLGVRPLPAIAPRGAIQPTAMTTPPRRGSPLPLKRSPWIATL